MLPGGRASGTGAPRGEKWMTAGPRGALGEPAHSTPAASPCPAVCTDRASRPDVHPRQHPPRTGGTGRVPLASSATVAPAPQHLRALQQANRVRLARAELKRQVADGERSVGEIVLECPWEAESMTIGDLLQSQHRWGHTRCRRFLSAFLISETKTIGSFTDRQRQLVAARLAGGETADAFDALTLA